MVKNKRMHFTTIIEINMKGIEKLQFLIVINYTVDVHRGMHSD